MSDMETLIAFHGEKEIKNKYLARVKAHEKADEIAHGFYWENGKGCAVGCTIEGDDHMKYEKELGIPVEVAYLEDVIFEELKNGESKKFPTQFLKAVKVGSDLSKVTAQLVIWQFEDKKYGLKHIKEIKEDAELYSWCEKVVALYRRSMTEKVKESEYYELYEKIDRAGAKARAGARAGAWAGARARARAGARVWAGARAWAWAGAKAGARVWARAGAWAEEEYYLALRDEFLRLIKNAPMKK